MGATDSAIPVTDVAALPAGCTTFDVRPEGDTRVVRVTGELDLATGMRLAAACTAGTSATTVIDLAAVTFMDCSGYGSLLGSRLVVEGEGRALTIRGQTGQPARFLELLATLEEAGASTK